MIKRNKPAKTLPTIGPIELMNLANHHWNCFIQVNGAIQIDTVGGYEVYKATIWDVNDSIFQSGHNAMRAWSNRCAGSLHNSLKEMGHPTGYMAERITRVALDPPHLDLWELGNFRHEPAFSEIFEKSGTSVGASRPYS